jgi:hypothetical protein
MTGPLTTPAILIISPALRVMFSPLENFPGVVPLSELDKEILRFPTKVKLPSAVVESVAGLFILNT